MVPDLYAACQENEPAKTTIFASFKGSSIADFEQVEILTK